MWGAILGGFTILGVFLTFSAWINGRSIKRYIGELIKEESRASRELMERLITKLSDQHESMIKILIEMAKTKAGQGES